MHTLCVRTCQQESPNPAALLEPAIQRRAYISHTCYYTCYPCLPASRARKLATCQESPTPRLYSRVRLSHMLSLSASLSCPQADEYTDTACGCVEIPQ
mmetsp:Transcript_40396/g.100249  ORF Transcript_40396/g.100249 Transcript_40396/m.100249 type:complete len:98 (-) Transcript_40396:791-1084(-)